MNKKSGIASLTAAALVASLATAAVSATAGAGAPSFTPVAAADNINALSSRPLFAAPQAVQNLGADIHPLGAPTYALGDAGYAWRGPGGRVCVLMSNRTGGCFTKFQKPAVIYLTGHRTSRTGPFIGQGEVTGVVPNNVTALTLVTTEGQRVRAPLVDNSFAVTIPAGMGIVGEEVTLAGGRTFFHADSLIPPL